MATEEHVMNLLAEANPYPDVETLPTSEPDGSTYLAMIEQRSTEVLDTQRRADTPTTRRPPWTTFSIAAAAVLVLGAVGILTLIRNGAESADGTEVARALVSAINAGTTELEPYVTDDATFGPMTVPLDDDLAAYWVGLETEISLGDCEQTAQVVRCSYEWSDAIRRAQGRPEYGALTFLVEDGRVGAVSREWDTDASGWSEAGDPVIHYVNWLNASHPDWDQGLTWVGEPTEIGSGFAPLAHDDPVHNAVFAAALTRYLDEYESHLETFGLEAPVSPCDITVSSAVEAAFEGTASAGSETPGNKCVYGITGGAAVQVEVLYLGSGDSWDEVVARYTSTRGGTAAVEGIGDDAFHPVDEGVREIIFLANDQIYGVVALGGPTPETLTRLGNAVLALAEEIAGDA